MDVDNPTSVKELVEADDFHELVSCVQGEMQTAFESA